MARSFISDPLLSYNFALIDVPLAGFIPLVFPFKLVQSAISNGTFVGMQTISLPTLTTELRDVKEGNWPYVHKVFAGHSSGGDCTLTQAVFPDNIEMYGWFLQGVWGRFGPRRNFLVVHLRNDKALPWRAIYLQDCLPTTFIPSSTLDAGSSEVCVESLTMYVTRIEILPAPVGISTAGG